MWRVTIRGFLANKLRFLLTGFAVALGVAFMSATMVLTDTVERTFDDLFADINEGVDAVVRGETTLELFGFTERTPVPEALVAEIERLPDVVEAEGQVELQYAQIVAPDGDAIGNPGRGAPALGLSWYEVEEINPLVIREGRAPEADDEIVIDRGSAKRGDIDVGDRVTVLTQRAPQDYEVVGIATFGTADSPAGASVVAFTKARAQQLADYEAELDSIVVVARDGVSQDEVARQVAERVGAPFSGLEVLTGEELTAEQQDDIAEALGFFSTALLVFAVIALFVGCFIIYNSFTIIVAQRTREMALLRAIGASARQVRLAVLGESLILALLASAAGLGAGIALSRGLHALFRLSGFDIPSGGVVVTTDTVVITLVVGVAITVLSALLPARRASRVPPLAALRDVAFERPSRLGRRGAIGAAIVALGITLVLLGLLVDIENPILWVGVGVGLVFVAVFVLGPIYARPAMRALGLPLARVKGMVGALARENAMRNPKRTAATASALVIGIALVGFITVVGASVRASVSGALDEQVTTDLVVSTGTGFGPGVSGDLAQEIATLPEVAASTPIRIGLAVVDGREDFVTAAEPVAADRLFDFGVIAGDLATLGPDEVAVSERTATEKGWRLGDPVAMTFVETGPALLTVGAIYEHFEVPDDYLMSLEGYERHFRRDLDLQIFIDLAPGVTIDEGRAAIEPLLEPYPVAELQDQEEFKQTFLSQINQVVIMIYVLLAVAVVIALFGIANTLALSIYERTRELGLLRAVGMTRAQVRSAVRWESVLISLLGTGLGVGLGVLFGFLVVTSLRDEGFRTFAVAPGQLLVVVVLGALAGVAAAVGPARRAAKLDVLDAIATE